MKKIFLFCIFMHLSGWIFSQDLSEDNTKNCSVGNIEVNFGGSLSTSFSIMINSIYVGIDSYDFSTWGLDYFYKNYRRPNGLTISVLFPFSFIAYPNKYFGIGINYSIGVEIYLMFAFVPTWITIYNKLKIINKFGNNDKKVWLLIEYGINLDYLESLRIATPEYFVDYNNFSIGPSAFIGYEKNLNNRFSYTVGLNFDAIFSDVTGHNSLWSDDMEIQMIQDVIYGKGNKELEVLLNIGLEVRLKVSFFHKI